MKLLLVPLLLFLVFPQESQERASNRPPFGLLEAESQKVTISGSSHLLGVLKNANMNSTADQEIVVGMAKYIPRRMTLTNCSATPTLAVGGFYTATSKGGTTIVANTQAYSSLSTPAKFLDVTLGAVLGTDVRTEGSLYFSLTTAAGITCTCDIYVIGDPLP